MMVSIILSIVWFSLLSFASSPLFPSYPSSLDLDLSKLCYDFTCMHSGVCTSSNKDGPICDCLETGYLGERCDKCKREREKFCQLE